MSRRALRRARAGAALAAVLLWLAGCVPLYVDHDAGPIAQREWSRLSNVAVEWTVWRVIGLPAVSLVADENGARGTLWLPWGCWGAAGRAAARYELAKTAHVLAVAQSERWGWLWPLAAIDSALHLPPSELRSWLAVFAAPPPPEPQGIIAGWVGEGPR